MNVLEAMQEAADLLEITSPTSVTASSARLLKALATAEGRNLAGRHTWQNMTIEFTFIPTATASQADALPMDETDGQEPFDRFVPYSDVWNRTANQKLSGPLSPSDWQELKASLTQGVSYGAWRIIRNQLCIWPLPNGTDTYSHEYVSKFWLESDGAVSRAKITANTDKTRFPTELLVTGIVWRYKSGKGFDYAEALKNHELEVEKACSKDRGGIKKQRQAGGVRAGVAGPTWNGVINVP